MCLGCELEAKKARRRKSASTSTRQWWEEFTPEDTVFLAQAGPWPVSWANVGRDYPAQWRTSRLAVLLQEYTAICDALGWAPRIIAGYINSDTSMESDDSALTREHRHGRALDLEPSFDRDLLTLYRIARERKKASGSRLTAVVLFPHYLHISVGPVAAVSRIQKVRSR